jgi:hypothetical protein
MIKKRIKSKLVNKSFSQFCKLVDTNQIAKAARLVVYLAFCLFSKELFNELRHANNLYKYKYKNRGKVSE